jgi:hypothetical protein
MDCGESLFRKIEVVVYCITLHGDILRHGLLREAHLYEK